jgi:NAD(P)-dependent dehydrogenase (short-subunit alcohol dehydrogenase family)
MSLKGKIALVTGGTSGIGRATAELFLAEGARVVVTGLENLDHAPAGVLPVRSDARKSEDCAALAETIREQFGRLDVAFFNAGVAQLAPFALTSEQLYTQTFDSNVRSVVFGLQALLPLFSAGGSVIVNSSLAALKASPNMSIYAASKGAVSALVRTLSVELAAQKIRVNTLSPALIETAIQGKFGLPAEVATAVREQYNARVPVGRWGQASEVAQLALFLASDASSYITGVDIPIDGGLMQS